jgi:signal transduction histidine kinase
VARGTASERVFRAVADEVDGLMGSDLSAIVRFEPDGTVAVMGAHGGPHTVGARIEPDRDYVVAAVRRTGQATRFDTDDPAAAGMPECVRALGIRSGLASPIIVDGQLWGAITIATLDRSLAAGTERRLADLTELLATAISNAQASEDLRRLVDEQAALRRVATLVARETPHADVFRAIAQEARQLLGAEETRMLRFEGDSSAVVVAACGGVEGLLAIGSRHPLGGENATSEVFRTGQPARFDDYRAASGAIADQARGAGIRCVVATPILVEGRLWGAMAAGSTEDKPLPPWTESRLGQFTELMGTAIANAEAHAEVERLVHEQAALRRVAMLVAEGAAPTAVFDAVAAAMERLLDADGVTLSRYEPDDEITVIAHSGANAELLPRGIRISHAGENVTTMVRRAERPARLEHYVDDRLGAVGEFIRILGVRVGVGAPIVVDGRLWGVIVANWRGEQSPPADTEQRMAQFAELLDTAIANADSRDQLTASRARLLTAADDARRRIVRDLHDGAQQRLVHTIVTLKLALRAFRRSDREAESLVRNALEHAQRSNEELRELAHGLLPPVLSHGGLRAGIDAVVARLDLPVDVDVPARRFREEIEASGYFIIAEALTNVVKHSHATHAQVRASVDNGMLRVEVRDDGIGGADASGHGLVGMSDRATALGGRLTIESPPGGGTVLVATLPIGAGGRHALADRNGLSRG